MLVSPCSSISTVSCGVVKEQKTKSSTFASRGAGAPASKEQIICDFTEENSMVRLIDIPREITEVVYFLILKFRI